ncbi:hypothetical protein [Salinibacterium sp. ZJ454]|uniref:hypothetical protein n=1 Tax=Salinibacterium sp. ZJ454 TaxID=2708339 RepID=UPI00141E4CA7|nr:hypothetical protein [Salinibacterium sp. ZJ454]
MSDQESIGRDGRGPLRLAAVLILTGVVVSALAGLVHPEGADANDHAAIFALYAASDLWTAVHLSQFVGMAVLVAGLVALYFALDPPVRAPMWLNRFGALSAIVALASYAVLQAVDGVALKHTVDAWSTSSGSDRASYFAAAEAMRWLEWGVRSYQSFMLGLAFILFGGVIIGAARVSSMIGYLMALSGAAYVAQGWIIGASGFSPANRIPTLAGIVLIVVWSVWLLVVALRATAARHGSIRT